MHARQKASNLDWLLVLAILFGVSPAVLAQGSIISSAGPVNRSMAGASVAAPLDAAGAIFWNPATLSGLPRSEMMFSSAVYYGTSRLTSVLPAGAFGPGVPPSTIGSDTRSDSGVGALPNTAIFCKPADGIWSIGFGTFAAGGFFSNYPATPTNPILSPRPPNGFGNGAIFTSAGFGQFILPVSVQLPCGFSIGFGPTVLSAVIQADPGSFAPPDDANVDGLATFPNATHTRLYWGLGFIAGVYWAGENGIQLGASIKSKQWMQALKYNAIDEQGFPRRLSLEVDFPMILSIGVAYTGLERWTFAVDVRWVDFAHTTGVGTPTGFNPDGSISAPGWKSVFTVASGVQFCVSESLSVRLGYLVNGNPIPDEEAFFNAGGAAIYEHSLYIGASYQLTERLRFSGTYVHILPQSISGPFFTPAGAVPGSLVRIDQRADLLDFGFSVNY